MPNRSSKAGHIPLRTCVICKIKVDKKLQMKFVLVDSEVVYVLNNEIGKRGYYVCNNNNCLQKIDKWVARRQKSRK